MIEWFRSLPKAMFVGIVLAGGVLFIVLSDPPRTVCDSQIQKFVETTKDFLIFDKYKNPSKTQSRFAKLMDTCKSTNSAGGCYELFMSMKVMIKEAHSVAPECYGKLKSNNSFKQAIWETLDLMAQLAWGTKPPLTPALKAGWFDPADLNLFCELKTTAQNVFSEDSWNNFAEGYFKSLPGAEGADRNETWQRMLFSASCASYL